MNLNNTAAVILAAGKGTRIKAPETQNKVTFKIGDKPIICHTVEHLQQAGIKKIYVVVGYASKSVKDALGEQVTYVTQTEILGTGHALKQAVAAVDTTFDTVMSLYGDDSAFYPPELLSSMAINHQLNKAKVSLLSILKLDPTGLGRILRNQQGEIIGIVEEKNATEGEREIKEVNSGLYCFNAKYVKEALLKVKVNPIAKEYYLTDIIEIARKDKAKIQGFIWAKNVVWFGVNTREELLMADKLKQEQEKLEKLSISI